MRRSLIHFWRIHLAVSLGVAVATAVLTGALLVGNSVRGSLRELTVDRLGRIDYALVSERFFPIALATDRLPESGKGFPSYFDEPVPAILLSGTAIAANTNARASRIQIHGIDERFAALWNEPGDSNPLGSSLGERETGVGTRPTSTPSLVINTALQRELNAEIGDPILISLEKQSDIHREFLLGSRDRSDVVQTLRLTLTKVVESYGIGRFGLQARQSLPLNAYISLPVLQNALGQGEKINAIFVASRDGKVGKSEDVETLQNALKGAVRLEDLDLTLREGEDYISLESTRFLLQPSIVEAAKRVATEQGLQLLTVMTYLANDIAANGRSTPYSTITAVDVGVDGDSLKLIDGSSPSSLADDEILLNQWTAEDLGVMVGDWVDLSYFVVTPREKYVTQRARFRLAGVVALEGLAADPTLTPKFPGVHDAGDMAEWNAPFPIKLNRIRSKDEAYWDKYGATPKAFVSASTGQRLWRSRFGELTAVRIRTTQEDKGDFEQALLAEIDPAQVGFVWNPVKAHGLKAASGATDFSMLFVGFSMFLIVSAALLVGLLFRLGIEQRAGEIGILLAIGYTVAAVRRRFIKEGLLLAGVGGIIGLGGAMIYAWLMMVGLRTWWVAAVGTAMLKLHISFLSLVFGYFISIAIVLFSIGWTVRQLGKMPIRSLLAGVTDEKTASRSRRLISTQIVAFVSVGLACALIVFGLVSGTGASAGLFFGCGAFLLISGLAFFSVWLRKDLSHREKDFSPTKDFRPTSLWRMGARNSTRRPNRSMLCVALVGSASFVILAMGAFYTKTEYGKPLQKASATGGFALVAESDIPIHHDLNSEAGQFELGLDETVGDAKITPFRLLPGEDASCLNLYRPEKPRILGVTRHFIERGGFDFKAQSGTAENPWQLLEQKLEPGVIPAIGDYNSTQWILHLELGEDLIIGDIKLRLVGLLRDSIFRSELLISESNFTKHFPDESGYQYFLIESPPAQADVLKGVLEEGLDDYGFDVTSTIEKLANYQAVQNTYLSTFQTLGGLGLLLGTLGLAILLLRNVIERSRELATLRAFGFRRMTLVMMLLAENGFLLVIGMLVGSVSALIAVGPHIISPDTTVPWLSLLMTLILVFLVGIVASVVSVFFALRTPLLPALKAE